MNETLQLIRTRKSVKKYKPDPVSKADLEQIVEAGLWAASGRNFQSPIILAVTNKELRDELSRLNAKVMGAESDPFYGAPAVLVVLAERASPRTYTTVRSRWGICCLRHIRWGLARVGYTARKRRSNRPRVKRY